MSNSYRRGKERISMWINTHTRNRAAASFRPLSTCHPEVKLKWWRQCLLILDSPLPPPSTSSFLAEGCDVTAIHGSHAFLHGSDPSHLLLFERPDRWQIPSPFPPSHSPHRHLNQRAQRTASCIPFILLEIILLWTHSRCVCVCTCVQATTAELNPNSLYAGWWLV